MAVRGNKGFWLAKLLEDFSVSEADDMIGDSIVKVQWLQPLEGEKGLLYL